MHARLSSTGSAILFSFGLLRPCLAAAPNSSEANWSVWRGLNHDGISIDSKWKPESLAPVPKIAWKTNVGDGYSAVCVSGASVFTMGFSKGMNHVVCLNITDGKEIWRHSYASGPGSYPGPRATPILDEDLIFTVGQEGQIVCLDAVKGTVKWQKAITQDFQGAPPQWGHSATPIVDGNLLVLNAATHGVALDKKTGKKEWTSPAGVCGYSAPVLYKSGAKKCLAIFGAKALYGVDLSSGQKLWSHPWETSYDVNAPDPIVDGDKVFITSGYGKGCAVIDIAGGSPKVVWQNKAIAAHFSSCVLSDGHIYGIHGNTGGGTLKCLDIKTGTERWAKDLGFGGFMVADKKIIMMNEKGSLYVAHLKPDAYTEIASAKDILSKTCWTSPVFCRGYIFCRNHKGDLVCVDVSK